MRPGGHALLEIGEGQAEITAAHAARVGMVHGATVPDGAGVDRVIGLARP